MQGTVQKSGKWWVVTFLLAMMYLTFFSQAINALENNMQFPWVDMWGCVCCRVCVVKVWQGWEYEADDPIKGTSVFTKPSGKLFQLIPNESYVESKKQRSRPDEEMKLKANLSYGEVRSSGATKVEANHSYGLAREINDLDKRVEYDYIDNELFGHCK